MDGTFDGSANIWVKPSGVMRILNSSNVTSVNSYNYTFWVDVGSTFEMRDSKISRCGYQQSDEKNKGLYVQANDALVENNVFGENYYCLWLNGVQSAKIDSNQFNKCQMQAVVVKSSNSAQISSNSFSINALESIFLSSCLNSMVSDNIFYNPEGIGLIHTNSSIIKGNEFRTLGNSIIVGTGYADSQENTLEDNIIAGTLDVYGISNTVKGGSIGNKLNIEVGANTNRFEGIDFKNSEVVMNSGGVTGTVLNDNMFDGTNFSEDNAVITLANNNTVHKATFGKNVSIFMTGTQNTIDNVTIQDCAGMQIGLPYVQGAGAMNTLSNSMVVLNFASGHGIVCDGPCLIANCTITDTNTLAQQATEREASLTGLVVAREAGLAASSVPETAAPKQQTSNSVQAAFLLIVLLGAAALFAFWAIRQRR